MAKKPTRPTPQAAKRTPKASKTNPRLASQPVPKPRSRSVLPAASPARSAAKKVVRSAKPVLARGRTEASVTARSRAKKPGAQRAARALILPPKLLGRPAQLAVASAPRTPRGVATAVGLEHAKPALRKGTAAAGGTRSSLPNVSQELPPCARVTANTWHQVEALIHRLGRLPLNDEQRVAVRAALEGEDTLVVMPDNERALSCYQVTAQLLERPTVVLSPVHSELRAQLQALELRLMPCVLVVPELSPADRALALARIARGGSLLVLLGADSVHAADVQKALTKSGIALFVVEEAHCASDAAHEVRPSYAMLGEALTALGSPPVMAVTRVATRSVRRDIGERLGLRAPVTVQAPVVPQNLRLVTKLARGESRQLALVRLVERLELPGLVFCATPHDVDGVYAALRGAGIAAYRHHAGMTASDRSAELAQFSSGTRSSVMVAVSAHSPGSGLPGLGEASDANAGFGRGPQRQDLRFVVHYQSPASLEQYVREIQYAGQDGNLALCVMLHESSHRSLHEVLLAQQRFKATHLAELGRALEASALAGRTVSVESLALATGQSRRTTDRLSALLADLGVVTRSAGSVRVLCSAAELDEACRRIGAQLYALREQDARRLAAVSALAESSECKLSCLHQYLGDGTTNDACGRCSACVSELLQSSPESLAPQAPSRRPAAQEFSVAPVHSGFAPHTAPLAPVKPLTSASTRRD